VVQKRAREGRNEGKLGFVSGHELVKVLAVDQNKPVPPDDRKEVFANQILERSLRVGNVNGCLVNSQIAGLDDIWLW
jgi:hypothetical protein